MWLVPKGFEEKPKQDVLLAMPFEISPSWNASAPMTVESSVILVFFAIITPKMELTKINKKMFIDMTSLNLANLSLKRASRFYIKTLEVWWQTEATSAKSCMVSGIYTFSRLVKHIYPPKANWRLHVYRKVKGFWSRWRCWCLYFFIYSLSKTNGSRTRGYWMHLDWNFIS